MCSLLIVPVKIKLHMKRNNENTAFIRSITLSLSGLAELSFQKSFSQMSLVRVIAHKCTMIILAPVKAVWDKGLDNILQTL